MSNNLVKNDESLKQNYWIFSSFSLFWEEIMLAEDALDLFHFNFCTICGMTWSIQILVVHLFKLL